jgi:uncharacterized cofD-like protein
MVRMWWLLAWTACVFGMGMIVGSIGKSAASSNQWFVGTVSAAIGIILLLIGWLRERNEAAAENSSKHAPEGKHRPRVVAIGGGTGLSVLLRGLKEYELDLTAIVTVADDGGSSGRLRSDFSMPAPGDIRNCLVALADTEPLMEELLQYRFESGEGLAGHKFGNLFLAAMMHVTGDFETAVQATSRVLAVRGRVLPAVSDEIRLVATADDGTKIEGESNIPKSGKRIKRLEIDPPHVQPLPEVLTAIDQADIIVVGPGSLYTSILPNLLIEGVVDRIRQSKARKVFVCNVMTQPGETDQYSASSHLKTVYDHVGPGLFDTILINHADVPDYVLQQYMDKGAKPVEADIDVLRNMKLQVIARNFLHYATYARHDPKSLADVIVSLVK